jgi:hypothetical protein
MYSLKTSNEFVKSENIIFAKDQIAYLDCYNIENLEVRVVLKNGESFIAKEIHAIELVMQIKPSLLEGKRLKWPKFVWCIHNLFAHPITQLLALCKLYKWAFWIHDVTVPKPVGKKK